MADDKLRIDIEVAGAERSAAKLKAVGDSAKVIASQSLSQRLSNFANSANAAYKANSELAESFSNVALKIGAFAASAIALNAVAENHVRQLSRLGEAYSSVEAATNGAISASDALKLRGAVNQAGLQMTANQLGLLTRAAREYAIATGEEASTAIEKLTNAIVNNSEDALSELGLAQARATSSTQTLANMTLELENRYRNAPPAIRTLNEEFAKLPTTLALVGAAIVSSATSPLSEFIDRATGVPNALRGILRDLNNLPSDQNARARDGASLDAANARERAMRALGRTGGGTPEQVARIRSMDAATAQRFEREISSQGVRNLFGANDPSRPLAIGGMSADLVSGLDSSGSTAGIRFRSQQNAPSNAATAFFQAERQEQERRERASRTSAVDSRSAMQVAADDKSTRFTKLQSSSGPIGERQFKSKELESQANPVAEFAQALQRAIAATDLLQGKMLTFAQALRLERSSDREQLEMFDSILETQEGGGEDARFTRARNQRRTQRDAETRRLARGESVGGRLQNALGFSTDESTGRIASFDGAKESVGLLSASVSTLQGGLSTLFETMVSGSADAGTAFQAFASTMLSELGKIAFQKGLFYTFEGLAALFSAPMAAPSYLAAGVGLMALGGVLGFAGSVAKPNTTPSSNASAGNQANARSLAPRSDSASTAGNSGSLNIVLSSLVPSGPSDVVKVRDGLSSLKRTLSGNRIPRRIEQ
jgi:hypothetical protein